MLEVLEMKALGGTMRTGKNVKIDVVLVGPVGDHYGMPSLAVSVLKRSLSDAGIGCRALYANLLYHRLLGMELLQEVRFGTINGLILERIFAPMAHSGPEGHDGGPFRGHGYPEKIERFYEVVVGKEEGVSHETFLEVQRRSRRFVEETATKIMEDAPAVVGFSSSFQTTNAILALAAAIKAKDPKILCIMGGNNCEGTMGEEIADKFPVIDFVFQGDGDLALAEFCRNYLEEGVLPPRKVVNCEPVMDLDRVSEPDYEDFMAQCDLPRNQVTLSFESSRGCWWGHKHQCKFCGESALDVPYRSKSPGRVLGELERLKALYPEIENYFAADSILPHGYFKTLLPALGRSAFKGNIVYETKANLTRAQVGGLVSAGVTRILAGIESLSARLLKMLNKGSTPLINLKMLRSAREFGLDVVWLILVGIPGDKAGDYGEQARIMPLLHHLTPPSTAPVRIQRSSPYFRDGAPHGVKEITPFPAYGLAYPESVDLDRLAYFFTADYPSESRDNPVTVVPFVECLKAWQESWGGEKIPELTVKPLSDGRFRVTDTRACAAASQRIIDRVEYRRLCRLRMGEPASECREEPIVRSFIEWGYLVEVEGRLLSIVCDPSETPGEVPPVSGLDNGREKGNESNASVSVANEEDSSAPMGNGGDSPVPVGNVDDSPAPMGNEGDSPAPMVNDDDPPAPMVNEGDSSVPMDNEDDSPKPMGIDDESAEPVEIETTLAVVSDDPEGLMESVAGLGEIAGFDLIPEKTRIIHDIYFDTPDRDLEKLHIGVRLRRYDDALLLTVKGPAGDAGGDFGRFEMERPWSEEMPGVLKETLGERGIVSGRAHEEASALTEPVEPVDPVDAVRALGLEVVQDRKTVRVIRNVTVKSGEKGPALAEMALDTVTYSFPEGPLVHREVEVEALGREGISAMEAVTAGLVRRFAGKLRPWNRGKIVTGKTIRGMAVSGELAGLIRDGGELLPAAYDLVEAAFTGKS